MKQLWQEIFQQYQRLAPDVLEDFNEPAASEHIEHIKRLTDNQLPDLYETYAIHNGQNGYRFSFKHPWKLYNIDNVLSAYQSMNTEVVEEWQQEAISPDEYSDSEGPARKVMWNSKWIPIASNGGGDLICIDLDPDEGGTVGQIITWHHETTFKKVEAASYRKWLETYLNDLQNDLYSYKKVEGLVRIK